MFRSEPARLARGKGRDGWALGTGASSVWMATVSARAGLRGVSALGAAKSVAGEASRRSEGWELVWAREQVLALGSTWMRRPDGGPLFMGGMAFVDVRGWGTTCVTLGYKEG